MSLLPAGALTRKITIQSPTETRNSIGEAVTTWSTFATVRAQRLDKTAREIFASDREQAERTTVYRLRYRSDLSAKMRVVEDGKTYDIEGITELGHKDGLEILAVRRGE